MPIVAVPQVRALDVFGPAEVFGDSGHGVMEERLHEIMYGFAELREWDEGSANSRLRRAEVVVIEDVPVPTPGEGDCWCG